MTQTIKKQPQIYFNVMETLVQEEIEKQLKFYPENIKPYMNKIEIATYALNRLPALYASSQLGKQKQLRVAKIQYSKQINSVVRRSLAAIERDPLRQSIPLVSDSKEQSKVTDFTLKKIENLLKDYNLLPYDQRLSWDNVTEVIQQALNRIIWLTKKEVEFEQEKVGEPSKLNCGFFKK